MAFLELNPHSKEKKKKLPKIFAARAHNKVYGVRRKNK